MFFKYRFNKAKRTFDKHNKFFCCDMFRDRYFVRNNLGFNIRIVRITNNTNKTELLFYVTSGYENFSLNNNCLQIESCPFCGVKLHEYYKNKEYANEVV